MNKLQQIWCLVSVGIVLLALLVSGAGPFVSALSLVGIVFVLGVAFKKPWSQLVGAVFVAMLAYASFTAGFLANAAVNGLVLAPLSIWGYFHWKSRKQHLEKNLTDTQKSSLALVLIGGTLIVYTFTAGAGGALPLLDALTSVIPIIATYLMAHAYRQQWWMWIPYNFLQALMWFSAASLQPAVLAVFALKMVFLVNSLIGYYNWKQKS